MAGSAARGSHATIYIHGTMDMHTKTNGLELVTQCEPISTGESASIETLFHLCARCYDATSHGLSLIARFIISNTGNQWKDAE